MANCIEFYNRSLTSAAEPGMLWTVIGLFKLPVPVTLSLT